MNPLRPSSSTVDSCKIHGRTAFILDDKGTYVCSQCAYFSRICTPHGIVDCSECKKSQEGQAMQEYQGPQAYEISRAPEVSHPPHYNSHPSGVECLTITRHFNFNRGNAIKYIWRAGQKDSTQEIQDLEKAIFYLNDEIARIKGECQ